MDILTAVYQILMMLGIALIGQWLRRRDVFSPPVIKGVNAIVLQVAMPALVLMISQKDYTPEVMDSFWRILLASTVLLAAGGVGLFLLSKRFVQPDRQAAFAAMVMLPNAAFMGIPIVTALYGDLGVAYLSGFIAAFNVAGWTAFHALFADRHANPLKPLMNAGFISTLGALVLIYFKIRLPVPFVSLFTQLGNLTTPLGMLLAGARLYELKPALLRDRSLWVGSGLSLLAVPLVMWLILKALGFTGMALNIVTLGFMMPSAVTVQLFAEKYDKDSVYAATGVSLTTLLCVVTIPLMMWVTGL